MPFSAATSAGIVSIQAGIVDINGVPWAATGIPAAGTPTPLKTMRFAKRFGGMIPSPVWATALGDNHRNIHEYAFNPATMAQLAFQFHAHDMDMYAGFLRTKKWTQGNGNAVGIQTNAPVNAAQACIVTNMDADIADPDGSFGEKRFLNEIYSLVTVVPKLGNLQEVTPVDWEYEGRPTQAGKTPWGIAFNSLTNGFTRGGGILVGSDYPLILENFLAVGAETSITLTYTPATPGSTYVELWKIVAGVSTPLSFTLSGKVLTVAALTAGDIVCAKYEATDYIQQI